MLTSAFVRTFRRLNVAVDTLRTASLNVTRGLMLSQLETDSLAGFTELTVGAMWSPVVNENEVAGSGLPARSSMPSAIDTTYVVREARCVAGVIVDRCVPAS